MTQLSQSKRILALMAAIVTSCASSAYAAKSVNVLSWWGYIDTSSPAFIAAEKLCNAKISLDEFYSNAEFITRFSSNKSKSVPYDLIIYSDTISEIVRSQIQYPASHSLESITLKYPPAIRSYFAENHYSNNTAIFQLSLTGFLWNKKNIEILPNLVFGVS